jgi:hypothetical protein
MTLSMYQIARLLLLCGACSAASLPAAAQVPRIGPSDLRLEVELSESGRGGSHVFDKIVGVALAENGRVVVADLFNNSIRVFESSGRLVREFGRRGGGPGEFDRMLAFGRAGQGVFVFDVGLRRVTKFALDGAILSEATVPTRDGERWESFYPWVPLRHGFHAVIMAVIVGSIEDRRQYDPGETLLLMRSNGDRVTTLGQWVAGAVRYRFDGWPGLVNFVPGVEAPPTGGWGVAGDSMVAVVDGVRGRIRVFRIAPAGATIAAEADLGWRPERLPQRQFADASVRALQPRHPRTRADQFHFYMPEERGRVERVLLDGAMRVWLLEAPAPAVRAANTPPRAAEQWTVIDPRNGTTAMTLQMPGGFSLLDIAGDRLAGVHTDALGVQSVRVFSIRP